MESARCLSGSIRSHTCIKRLILDNCDLGNSPEILSVILQSNAENISLDKNNIDSLGAEIIAKYLEVDPPIEGLSLDHNQLNDNGCNTHLASSEEEHEYASNRPYFK